MKSISNNKTELQTGVQFTKNLNFKRAVVVEIEYDNNTTGETITFINNESNEECIVGGLRTGLMRQDTVLSVKFTVCSFLNGVLEPYMFYDRHHFTVIEKIEATNGSHAYYLKNKLRREQHQEWLKNNPDHKYRGEYAN